MPIFGFNERQVHVKELLIAKTHLYGVVERKFPVGQSLGAPCLPEVGSHSFSDFSDTAFLYTKWCIFCVTF